MTDWGHLIRPTAARFAVLFSDESLLALIGGDPDDAHERDRRSSGTGQQGN